MDDVTDELKIKIGEIIEGLEGHCQRRTVDDIGAIIDLEISKAKEEERERIKQHFLNSMVGVMKTTIGKDKNYIWLDDLIDFLK